MRNINASEYMISDASKIVREYIDMNEEKDTLEEFCNSRNISINYFQDMVLIVMENDSKLFDLYMNKIKRLYNKEYIIMFNKINKILSGIKNGILLGSATREFNILDCYKIMGVPIGNMLRLSRRYISGDDMDIICEFVMKYRIQENLINEEYVNDKNKNKKLKRRIIIEK